MTLTEIIANANGNSEFIPGMSSNELFYGTSTDDRLTDVIADVAEAVLDKADEDHTHEGYASVDHSHSGYAPAEHSHDGFAPADHSHTGYAPADHSHNYAAPLHSHAMEYINGLPEALNGKADLDPDGKVQSSQLPDGVYNVYLGYMDEGGGFRDGIADVRLVPRTDTLYVDTNTGKIYMYNDGYEEVGGVSAAQKAIWDSKAEGNHGHSYNDLSNKPTIPTIPSALPANGGNADTVDNKHASDFASASHNHSASDINSGTLNAARLPTVPITKGGTGATTAAAALTALGAFPTTGGTIDGDVNVAGVLRVNNQQSFYFQTSTNSQTVGTNNATGGTTICCGSEATVNVNGGLMKTPTVVPRSNNLCYCGNSSLRWKGIYSTAAVNVSSDERLKRDIAPMDGAALAAFIEKLNVVSYNYKDDAEDAKSRIGLIAQDVQRADADIAKFFVDEDENGMLGLTPADLVFPLIAAVQALTIRVEDLEAKLEGK